LSIGTHGPFGRSPQYALCIAPNFRYRARESVTHPAAMKIDRVHVSWTRHLELDAYVDDYLRRRRQPAAGISRAAAMHCMSRYIGRAPFTKADLDFYLDANLLGIVP
jgi:hypothetical protein